MRNLAAIQKIHDIKPIPGADNIELIHVLGWQCVHGSARSAVHDRDRNAVLIEAPLSMKV